MLGPREDRVEVPHDELREIQSRDFGKLMPKKALVTKAKRVMNHINEKVLRRIRRNHDM